MVKAALSPLSWTMEQEEVGSHIVPSSANPNVSHLCSLGFRQIFSLSINQICKFIILIEPNLIVVKSLLSVYLESTWLSYLESTLLSYLVYFVVKSLLRVYLVYFIIKSLLSLLKVYFIIKSLLRVYLESTKSPLRVYLEST